VRAVAIPGELGSFSHAAALAAHQSAIRLVPCVDFPELFRTVVAGHADCGIVPIENSLTGSIHENYDLLRAHGLCIVDETEIRVRHCLIARPGTTLQQVHVVAVAWYDTAGSVRDLMNDRVAADAAIASDLAAQLYGGAILCDGLEDHAANYTRFLVVSRDASPAPRPVAATSKTSLIVTLANVPGSLHRALGPFARRGLDLSKIESRPLPGRPWEYVFYLDVLGDPAVVAAALAELREGPGSAASSVRVLGSYPRNGGSR
jgi:prephenate dehydratase